VALIDTLNSVRDMLSISPTVPAQVQIGQPIHTEILPSLDGVEVSDIISSPINFSFVGKGVVFTDANPANPATLQSLPFFDLSTVPPTVRPGVPGLLGAVTGTVPVAIQLPVKLEVEWSVRAQDGTVLNQGAEFLAPDGLSSPKVTVVFLPQVVELTTGVPAAPVVPRILHARVRLTASGTSTAWRDLPDVSVNVPGIAVPTLLAAFLDTNFQGAILVMVPSNSPFGSLAPAVTALNNLQAALAPLSSIARFAAFVSGLQQLTSLLNSEPHIQFRATAGISNLNDITLISRSWYENDTEAEDELSSMILIGPFKRRAECFNDRGFDDDEGKFTLTLGLELFAAIRTLHSASPVSEPRGDEIVIDTAPPGGWFEPDTFGDELSSIRFSVRGG